MNEYEVAEHPRKDAIDTDVKDMAQPFLISELRRLGTKYPDKVRKYPSWLEAFDTCIEQWPEWRPMSVLARKLHEDVVRALQSHDRWVREIQSRRVK